MKLRLIGLAALVALVAAACGGDDAADGVASLSDAETPEEAAEPSASSESDVEEAVLAFTQCLRDQGIDIDDPTINPVGSFDFSPPQGQGPGGGGPGGGGQGFQGAFQECSYLLEGVALPFQQQDFTDLQDNLVEFAACMRDNGYDMPDPDFSNLGPGRGGPGQGGGPFGGAIDPDDPVFQAALEACQDIFGGELFQGPGQGGGGRLGQGSDD